MMSDELKNSTDRLVVLMSRRSACPTRSFTTSRNVGTLMRRAVAPSVTLASE